MKKVIDLPEAHLLICTNERPDGNACCKKVGGHEFFLKMKEELAGRGLRARLWVTRTGCLGYCNDVGCVVALYRHGETKPTIHSEVTDADFSSVLDAFLS